MMGRWGENEEHEEIGGGGDAEIRKQKIESRKSKY
jgi:hypothetical protein